MPRALLSVSDKTNLLSLARGLLALHWQLIATGSTAKFLRENNMQVTEVSAITNAPEMLGGRVKTLHPAIHAGILARDTIQDKQELKAQGWDYIDLVAVNLYPFVKTVSNPSVTQEDAIEQIDIGGVALLRAAAKNHQRVIILSETEDYENILAALRTGEVSIETKKQLAIKAFRQTSEYDSAIIRYFEPITPVTLNLFPVQSLRYGENPHQTASLYSYQPNQGPMGGKLLQGKPLSYNNLLDLDTAWRAVLLFSTPSICIVKHASPCGVASAEYLVDAFRAALASDPISAFGGIIASNVLFDAETAEALEQLFAECIIAPAFSPQALAILEKRTTCRLLQVPSLKIQPLEEWRSINGGLLKQTIDSGDPEPTSWQVVSKRQPTEQEWRALRFAWKACQTVKSNAIVLAQGESTVGIGGGQPNRIDCVKMAITRANKKAKHSVMASDAFFPFDDCVKLAAEHGITAVIHPGGSKRDQDSITVIDEHKMTMVVTGVRHFRH